VRPHAGRREHLRTVASRRGCGTEVATLRPSAGRDVAAVSAAAWPPADPTQSYSSRATLAADSPHDQSTTATNTKYCDANTPCCGIERVEKLTILGIIVNSSLTATDHVSYLLDSCSGLLHALRVLRSHGLPSQSLKDVFDATVIGKLIYCAPAWHGFRLASDYTRLNSFLRRAVKLGYYDTQSATARDLFCDADDALFHKILYNKAHLLHMYLPDRSQIVYTLRNRNHNKILIPKTSDLNERHFLIRVLYKHCY